MLHRRRSQALQFTNEKDDIDEEIDGTMADGKTVACSVKMSIRENNIFIYSGGHKDWDDTFFLSERARNDRKKEWVEGVLRSGNPLEEMKLRQK